MNWNMLINRLTLIGVLILLVPSWFKPIYALFFWMFLGTNFINQGVAIYEKQEKGFVMPSVAGVIIIEVGLLGYVR